MARLNRTQRRTARIFTREADRAHASPRERKALFEAGLVEANLTNPRGGDASSVGSLQEQSHYGSVQRRMNRGKAARRFLTEARAVNRRGFKGSAGQLAQAVQRSAFPGRYDERSDEADAILAHFAAKSSNPRDTAAATQTMRQHVAPVSYEGERRAAALSYFSQRGRPGALLGLAQSLSAIPPDQPGGTVALPAAPGRRRRRRGTVPGSGGGHIVTAAGANLPGRPMQSATRKFVRKVSGIAGETLTIGTGTNHKLMTVNGNPSDHPGGMAADIPAKGERLIRLGQAALIAAGMNPKKARKQRGGLYNINGHQIIFNTHEGGDHTDHLHVTPKRR